VLRTETMLESSNPDSLTILVRASRIIVTQFVTMARVSAISRAMRPKRVLLRRRARTIGPSSMISPLSYWTFRWMAGAMWQTRQAG
jgi:hypothetical protein